MRLLRRLGALLGLIAAGAASAAEPPLLAARAAEECQRGELDAAANTLGQLLAELESRYGAASDSALLVRLNLSHVEAARGRAEQAKQLEERPGGEARGEPDAATRRSLRKLRACAAVEGDSEAPVPQVALVDRVNLARNQLLRGRFAEALRVALDAREAAGADAPPAELMRLYETLALIELQLGHPEPALRAAEAADRYARALSDVGVRITVARLVAQVGDLALAGERLEELAPTARSKTLAAEWAEARGDLELRLGAPREALRHLARALEAHRGVFGADNPSTAAVLQLQGDAHRQAGDLPAALAAYHAARDIRTASLGADHADAARTLNAIGVLEADLGDWSAADRTFADAERRLAAALGEDHPEILTVRSNRALAAWGERESSESAAAYAEVVKALTLALGIDHPSVAAAVRNLARMELDLGNAVRAEQLLEGALAAQTRSLGADHPSLAPTRLARARVLAHRGRLDPAARETDAAIAVLTRARGPEHPVVVRARALRARIAVAAGDDATAFREARTAARALAGYTRRTFGAISDRQRALLSEDAERVADALLSVETAPPQELLLALLPQRDAVLRSIAAGRAAGAGGSELAEARRRYVAAALATGPGAAERSAKLAARIDALEARAAGSASLPERDPQRVLAEACKRLPEDAVLLRLAAYERTRPGAGWEPAPAHAALVVRGGSCQVQRVTLGSGAAIDAAAEGFARAMRDERADDAASRGELARLLLEPLAPLLADASRWWVIPDGALWGVPLGVLPDPRKPQHYLFERVTLGYLTSTHELADARTGGRLEADGLRSLLVGAPEFGSGAGPVVVTEAGPCQLPPFEPLPATRQEIAEVGETLGEPERLTGAEVTKGQLVRALERHPRLLHFATHAYFAGSGCAREDAAREWRPGDAPIAPNPLLLSGIVLAEANAPRRVGDETAGGILTAYEVSGLDLREAGLVVLSACDTGTGLTQRGQEVLGLRWGFRAAGARALVTSLWRSNDLATRSLMQAFYQALLSEDLPDDAFRGAEALRRAQLAQVAAERRLGLQRPLTWANFVFSGAL